MTDIDVLFTDGTIPNLGYHKWYHIYGYGEPENKCLGKFPLLALHGGLGECHDYIESVKVLTTTTGWRAIFYDQIGCGNSSIPTSRQDLWTVETYVDEIVIIVCDALGLERIHLLGQSWRGVLAMEYCLAHDCRSRRRRRIDCGGCSPHRERRAAEAESRGGRNV